MSARIYPIGAKMKPPTQPAKDLLDVNVQLTELQVTSDFTLETCKRLDSNIKEVGARLDNNMKDVGTRLDTLTSDTQQLKETVAHIDLKIQLLQDNHEQRFNHLEGEITDIKAEIKGIKAEMKNIISWKDRAVGVLLAFTSLCSAVVSVLVVVRSFF